MSKLSVIIITQNEAHNIADCLKSLSFADEIIVLDANSTDDTVALCQSFGAHVTVTPDWPGCGPQKQRALAKAQHDWVLSLDADERITPALVTEIQHAMNQNTFVAFDIPFQSTYFGKQIRFGDWTNESHIRLFHRHFCQFTSDIVHCRMQIDGKVGKLKHKILHHPYQHVDAVLRKMNLYSTLGAELLFSKGRTATLWTALSHSLWSFFRGYFLRLGFLDGKEGYMLAVSNAQGTYYRYLKLMYLCQKQK